MITLRAIAAPSLTCALVLALSPAADAVVRNVPQTYPTIQAAINASVNFDIVQIAAGTFSGAGNRDINLLGKSITVRGAGIGQTIIDLQGSPENQHVGFIMHTNETAATVIADLTITNGYSFDGPAMHLHNASPTVRNVEMTGNHADCWGGALYYQGTSSPKFNDCRFVGNFSAAEGGAIFGFNGSPIFTNCVIADNQVGNTGSAVLMWNGGTGTPKLVNCTVVNNTAPAWGDAIYADTLQITNSIIWGNAGEAAIYNPNMTPLTVKHSLVQGGYAGVGNIAAAPTFVNAEGGDFHLVHGSAGIDGGDPATVVPLGTVDLDGDPRAFGPAIDMGIDEFRKPGDATGDHQVNISDLMLVIETWGPCSWSTADLNSDFMVNVTDLTTVIANWGL